MNSTKRLTRQQRVLQKITDSHIIANICRYCEGCKGQPKVNFLNFCMDYIESKQPLTQIIEEYNVYIEYNPKAVKHHKMCIRYGEEDGTRRWNEYCNKQAKVNTFEHKKEKYGWTIQQFNEYNQSRAVTKDNLVNRHGPDKGNIIWNKYVERQRIAGVKLSYFIDKYGHEIGTIKYKELNKQKGATRDNFIRKYGEIEGERRYIQHASNLLNAFSRVSQHIFDTITANIPKDNIDNIFYATKNTEYMFMGANNQTHFVDFYDLSSNKVIEFYGDYYHMNPEKYTADYYNPTTGLIARDKRIQDSNRISCLQRDFGCDTMIIWESEYNRDKKSTINKCLKFLNYES